jgi:hypothetical protein
MNDLEERLRSALRPVDPGDAFADRVMRQLATEPQSSSTPPPRPAFRWLSAGLVASMVLGVCITWQYQTKRAEGLEARRQLIEALRLTDKKLDSAYRIANSGT